MNVQKETHGKVGVIKIRRAQALNALDQSTMLALLDAAEAFEADADIGCIVLAGEGKAFSAGADIRDLASRSRLDLMNEDYFRDWERLTRIRKPKIAAVAGYALGGGCELAMMCDIIYAAASARFGQPEIRLGVIPGMGGTQRLTRLVGRTRAMELILTGRMMDAEEALQAGLVSRVFPDETFESNYLESARVIAEAGVLAVQAAREAIDACDQVPLREGLLLERRMYHSLWDTPDQQEGMAAFLEKREPVFGTATRNTSGVALEAV